MAVAGDRIAAVAPPPGQLPLESGARTIDAGGRLVCPGFVDAHSHSDWSIHTNPGSPEHRAPGDHDGGGGQLRVDQRPRLRPLRDSLRVRLAGFGYHGEVGWSSFGEYLDAVRAMGISPNLAWFVGHSTVRAARGWWGPG